MAFMFTDQHGGSSKCTWDIVGLSTRGQSRREGEH